MAAPNIPGAVPDPVGNAVTGVQPIQPKGPSKAETDEDYFLNEYKGCTLKYDDKKDKYEPMLYDFLKIVDIDKSGEITVEEMDEMADIIVISKKAKANNSSELNYKHLPKAVSDAVSVWDTDKSGSVGVAELMAAAEAQKKMEKENTLVKKLLIGAMIVMAILMGGTFVLSLTAAEMAKEMKPKPDGRVITPSGKPAAMIGTVVERRTLVEFPSLGIEKLKELRDFSFVKDGANQFRMIGGFEWHSSTKMTLYSTQGEALFIEGEVVTLQTPDGALHTIDPWDKGRTLFGGGLVTSGSFSMMASAAM